MDDALKTDVCKGNSGRLSAAVLLEPNDLLDE
jgi:hypothetical protein